MVGVWHLLAFQLLKCSYANIRPVWLPLQDPATEFNGEIYDAGGITAFIGATIFEIGSILLMLEAVNENRADCFGWALEEVLEEKGLIRLKKDGCTHSQKNKRSLFGRAKGLGNEYLSLFEYALTGVFRQNILRGIAKPLTIFIFSNLDLVANMA